MREERLLERIRQWEKEPMGRDREDPKKAIDSVVRHLQRLLNTHQGSVEIAEDYGVPDFMNLLQRGPEASIAIENTLRDVIEKYEPRLDGVRVRFDTLDDNKMAMRFHIQGRLNINSKPVTLETVVGPNGNIKVAG